MAYTIISFDGHALNGTSGIRAGFPSTKPWDRTVTVSETKYRNFQSGADYVNMEPWQFDVQLTMQSGMGVDYKTMITSIEQSFSPYGKKVTRQLVAKGHDGQTLVFLDCYVVGLSKTMDTGVRGAQFNIVATLRAQVPFWQSVALNSSTSSPIINAGNAPAYAKITFAGGGVGVNYKVFTVTDTTGRGLVGYPVMVTSAIGVTTNYFAFVNGVSVPTVSGTASTNIWVRVDCVPNGVASLVFFYGSGVATNPLQGGLNLGSVNRSSATNTSSAHNSYLISTYPIAPLTWLPVDFSIVSGGPTSSGFSMDDSAGTAVTFTMHNPASGDKNDAQAMAMSVGTQTGTTNAISSGFSRVTANFSAGVRAFVRGRLAGSVNWFDTSYLQTTSGTVTTTIDIDNAVELVAGIEYTTTGGTDGATLTLSGSHTIALITTPTVASSSSGTLRIYDGTLTNSTTGQVITFTTFHFVDGTLTFDCNADPNQRSISNSNTNAPCTVGGFSFSDPVDFFTLAPGSNAWATTLPGSPTITVSWRDTFV